MPLFSFSGKRPDDLGVTDGSLKACPSTPNCVCSQAEPSDREHYIEPLPRQGSPADAIAALRAIVSSMERSEINAATDTYLYAEFASKIMGFVDDIEFYADPNAPVVHVRSAARLGKSDLGVNRKRVEAIRARFTASA
ncbi:MAG: DUF1499 domain-containing protein [Leptolyngbya sp. SIO4C1]|nr:DUF1499 domain-containing protein [Leptolyngbya sp. SIO4C1]